MQILILACLYSAASLTLLERKWNEGGLSSVLTDSGRIALQRWEDWQKVSNEPDVDPDMKTFLRSLRPCASCQNVARYGESGDGGYVMCNDDLESRAFKSDIVGAYSYGVNGYDGWGNDISTKFKIPVFQYDCTSGETKGCPTCDLRFHKECIWADGNVTHEKPRSMKDLDFATMSEQMHKNGHAEAKQGSLVMKMDIEGAEWSVLAAESKSNLQKFRTIVFEFHDLFQDVKVRNQVMQKLFDAGFVVHRIHGNPFMHPKQIGNYVMPKLLKITFVQRTKTYLNSNNYVQCKGSHIPVGPLDSGDNQPTLPVLV